MPAAPDAWSPDLDAELDDDFCIIDDERFYVHAQHAEADVWVEISEDAFKRFADVWEVEGREAEGPVPGRFEDGRATRVRLRPVGERPVIVVEAD